MLDPQQKYLFRLIGLDPSWEPEVRAKHQEIAPHLHFNEHLRNVLSKMRSMQRKTRGSADYVGGVR